MNQSRRSFMKSTAVHATAGAMGLSQMAQAHDTSKGSISYQGTNLLPRMSQRAKRAIRFAMDEAIEMQLPVIDSQCLLIGLAGEAEVSGAGWLSNLGITLDDIRQVRDTICSNTRSNTQQTSDLTLDVQSRTSLQFATEHADLMGYQRVYPEHVLLGLIDEPSFAASELLNQMWIESSAVELEAIASLPSWGSVHHRFGYFDSHLR